MKTPLENLIEYIEEWQPKNKHTEDIWSKAKQLLFEEREGIEKAHLEGFKMSSECYNYEYYFAGAPDNEISKDIDSLGYYQKTFDKATTI